MFAQLNTNSSTWYSDASKIWHQSNGPTPTPPRYVVPCARTPENTFKHSALFLFHELSFSESSKNAIHTSMSTWNTTSSLSCLSLWSLPPFNSWSTFFYTFLMSLRQFHAIIMYIVGCSSLRLTMNHLSLWSRYSKICYIELCIWQERVIIWKEGWREIVNAEVNFSTSCGNLHPYLPQIT